MLTSDLEITGPQPGAQTEFLSARQPDGEIVEWAICGGEFFGGKSVSLAMEGARNVDHPYYRGDIFRRTYKQLTDSGGMCDICSILYPPLKGVPTNDRLKWTFPSGATILLHHLQHDSDVFNYRSSQFCYLGIDQCEEFPFEALFYLMSRNRPAPYYNRPSYCRMSCNPEPGQLAKFLQYYWDERTGYHIPDRSGHIRYFTRENNKIIWVQKDYLGKDGQRPISFTYIYLPRKQNVKGMARDPNYDSRLAGMDEVSYERHGKGNWKINYSGGMFNAEWFKYIKEECLPQKIRWVRYWDFAASEVEEGKDPDWTAGVLIGEYGGDIYIKDVIHFRENPGTTIKCVEDTARSDGVSVAVRWEEEKGSAGKFNTSHLSGKLLGYDARSDVIHGDKIERAKPLASAAYNRHVFLVEGSWNNDYVSEATMFGSGKGKKDQIDASSGGLKCLCLDKRIWSAFSISKAVEINVNWNSYSGDILHYGAVVQEKDNSIYTLSTLWNFKEARLYVYFASKFDNNDFTNIALSLTKNMRLKTITCNKIIGNGLLFGSGIKTNAFFINKALKEIGVEKRITESIVYDAYGSITYLNALFNNNKIVVDNKFIAATTQIASWSYKSEGKEPEFGYGFCECLCLIGSELKREIAKRPSILPPQDYKPVKQPEPMKVNNWQAA